jgi:hypothetical protein
LQTGDAVAALLLHTTAVVEVNSGDGFTTISTDTGEPTHIPIFGVTVKVTVIGMFELFIRLPAMLRGNVWLVRLVYAPPPVLGLSVEVTTRSNNIGFAPLGTLTVVISILTFAPSHIGVTPL